jgi:hypothetical protein
MITGDDKGVATETARVLGMGAGIQGTQGLPVSPFLGLPPPSRAPCSLPLVCVSEGRLGDRRRLTPVDRRLMVMARLRRTLQTSMARSSSRPVDSHRWGSMSVLRRWRVLPCSLARAEPPGPSAGCPRAQVPHRGDPPAGLCASCAACCPCASALKCDGIALNYDKSAADLARSSVTASGRVPLRRDRRWRRRRSGAEASRCRHRHAGIFRSN